MYLLIKCNSICRYSQFYFFQFVLFYFELLIKPDLLHFPLLYSKYCLKIYYEYCWILSFWQFAFAQNLLSFGKRPKMLCSNFDWFLGTKFLLFWFCILIEPVFYTLNFSFFFIENLYLPINHYFELNLYIGTIMFFTFQKLNQIFFLSCSYLLTNSILYTNLNTFFNFNLLNYYFLAQFWFFHLAVQENLIYCFLLLTLTLW